MSPSGDVALTTGELRVVAVGLARIEDARRRASPELVDVLCRYPLAPAGRSRVAHLLSLLDRSLRTPS